jgi:transcriptional regulator with XRE-family HTH domain
MVQRYSSLSNGLKKEYFFLKKNKIITMGPVIKRLRMARQLTQEDLADLSKLDLKFISNIERNNQLPGFDSIYALAEAFDMKGSELLKIIEDYNDQL